MRKLTIVAAALLVVLAGSGIASASVLTLSITLDRTTIYVAPEVGQYAYATYTVWGIVTENDWYDATNDITLNGGLATFKTGIDFTGTGQGTAQGIAGTTNARATFDAHWPVAKQGGSVVDTFHNPLEGGTGGTIATAAADAGFTYPDDYVYDEPVFEYGNGTLVRLYTNRIYAVAGGTVTLTTAGNQAQCIVYTLAADEVLQPAIVDTLINAPGVSLTIVGTTSEPTVTITTPNVGEADWTQEPGWNNPLHTVSIAADTTDATTFVWKLTNPDTGNSAIVGDTEDLVLTMADILGSAIGGEVPLAGGIAGVTYDWTLELSVNEGAASDSITVFVPEPATMGLLAFGVVGLLRRRRA